MKGSGLNTIIVYEKNFEDNIQKIDNLDFAFSNNFKDYSIIICKFCLMKYLNQKKGLEYILHQLNEKYLNEKSLNMNKFFNSKNIIINNNNFDNIFNNYNTFSNTFTNNNNIYNTYNNFNPYFELNNYMNYNHLNHNYIGFNYNNMNLNNWNNFSNINNLNHLNFNNFNNSNIFRYLFYSNNPIPNNNDYNYFSRIMKH